MDLGKSKLELIRQVVPNRAQVMPAIRTTCGNRQLVRELRNKNQRLGVRRTDQRAKDQLRKNSHLPVEEKTYVEVVGLARELKRILQLERS